MPFNRKPKEEDKSKILDVDASMQGSLTFNDPVHLRINGRFEGKLLTKGTLEIGEHAVVTADIRGDIVNIRGVVTGNVEASTEMRLASTSKLVGNISTPSLAIEKGGVFQGHSEMLSLDAGNGQKNRLHEKPLSAEELARYLDVEKNLIFEWANSGKLPGFKEGDDWRFRKTEVDEWVASGRIK